MRSHPSANIESGRGRRSWWIVAALISIFFVIRVPLIYRQIGGHDEEYLSVAGFLVLKEGIPRVPYILTRDPKSVVYKADEAYFAYPPLFCYWLAIVYSFAGANSGSAQLASALVGAVAVVLAFLFGRRWFSHDFAALAGAALYSISRPFYLPAMHARPDMLCAMLGFGALLAVSRWHSTRGVRPLAFAGALSGATLLAHPFGIVCCLQVGFLVLASGRNWQERLRCAALLTGCALLAFACWLPLILAYREQFWVQFSNQIVNRSMPGLLERFVMPWQYLWLQAQLFAAYAGAWQTAIMAFGLLSATVACIRRREPGLRLAVWFAWSGVILLAIFEGEHPIQSYSCYTSGPIFLCSGWALMTIANWTQGRWRIPPLWTKALIGAVVLALMLPGSGLRAWVVHLRHWNAIDYNRQRFTERLINELPENATYLVDPDYVFDFYRAGRRTLLRGFEQGRGYDYFVAGPISLGQPLSYFKGEKIRTYGSPDNTFACYAAVYRPPKKP